MLQRLRHRAQSQEGFTLIELLVVILIIGILAAVAIPTFLSQTSKAYDSNVQASLNSIQQAESTYSTSNGGYVAASGASSSNPLITIEPTLTTAFTATPAGYGATVTAASNTGYTASATDSKDNVIYTLAYTSNGGLTKTCALVGGGSANNVGGCNSSGNW